MSIKYEYRIRQFRTEGAHNAFHLEYLITDEDGDCYSDEPVWLTDDCYPTKEDALKAKQDREKFGMEGIII